MLEETLRKKLDETLKMIDVKNKTILMLTDQKLDLERVESEIKLKVSELASDQELLQYQDRVIELLSASAQLTNETKAIYIEENMGEPFDHQVIRV